MQFLAKILKLFKLTKCKHEPYPFRSLNDSDTLVCMKCGKNYKGE